MPTAVAAGVGGAAAAGAGLVAYKSLERTRHFEELRKYMTFRWEELGERSADAFVRGLRGQRDLMLKSEPALRRLSGIPGFAWLNDTLDWLKRQKDEPPPP
ncbi:hypothetical protein [Roseomonas sp. HF4]|uniref:hypothetical protein n=1 Tax=Roseomonas sp. HF4 TaxID=2562313 RepID=UPI001484F7BF|nr:hypothetical protein [Roseomonas sp. HF4]